MGRVKIAKKSTFIDMTAMSDVTVLLLTFFMLTSTFLSKEPATVITPPSVSTEKVQETNYVQVLVNPEGKVWLTMNNDTSSNWSNEKMRIALLDKVSEIYNESHKNKISFVRRAPQPDGRVPQPGIAAGRTDPDGQVAAGRGQ